MRAVTAILVLAASLLVQPALTGDVHARPLDEVVAAGELRAIAYLDNAPFSWDDNGTAQGIDVEIAKALARELSVKAEIILRMQGEKADDDLRVNVWKGPLTGGGVGDIMMHVPIDREFALRNKEAVLGNAYFQEQVALAIHPELTGDAPTFDTFKSMKVGVKLGTVSDYFLMSYQDGALIENVAHHVKDRDGIEAFTSKSVAALLGTRSNIEALLSAKGVKPVIVRPDMDGIVRRDWIVGMAWKDNSRDLGYALAAALDKIKSSGELEKIFSDHGVTYVAPPLP
jgi:polar amino acid transport system substrate-binding protein